MSPMWPGHVRWRGRRNNPDAKSLELEIAPECCGHGPKPHSASVVFGPSGRPQGDVWCRRRTCAQKFIYIYIGGGGGVSETERERERESTTRDSVGQRQCGTETERQRESERERA